MDSKKYSLETKFISSRERYHKNFPNCEWQWENEGKAFCLMDYLSSMEEFSEEDWKFFKREGLEDLAQMCLDIHNGEI